MRTMDALIVAGRKAILPLVRSYVMASVTIDGELADGHLASRSVRADWRPGVLLSIELTGPGSGPLDHGRMISVKHQVSIWRRDEVVPAVRRAAEKIIRAHPAWRRLPEPRHRSADAVFGVALFARSVFARSSNAR